MAVTQCNSRNSGTLERYPRFCWQFNVIQEIRTCRQKAKTSSLMHYTSNKTLRFWPIIQFLTMMRGKSKTSEFLAANNIFNSVVVWMEKLQSFVRKSIFLAVMQCNLKNSRILAENPSFQQSCEMIQEFPRFCQPINCISSGALFLNNFHSVRKSTKFFLFVLFCKSRTYQFAARNQRV